jgi:molybdate transport system regulatory protein
MAKNKSKFSYKIWIEYEGKPVLGKGGAQILEQIEKEKSISKAAEKLGMSYRYVWSYLQRIKKAYGEPVVETYRGGKLGGGGAKLTKNGKKLLAEYKRVEDFLAEVLAGKEYYIEKKSMKN